MVKTNKKEKNLFFPTDAWNRGNSLFHAIDAIEVRSSVGSQQRREFPSPFPNRMSEYIYIYTDILFIYKL